MLAQEHEEIPGNMIIEEDVHYDVEDMGELVHVTHHEGIPVMDDEVVYEEEDLDDEEDERTDGFDYGGMSHEFYDQVVEFKRSGIYPPSLNIKQDRSAPSHWRTKCQRFILANDNETLLYFNPASAVVDTAKVVVKKGEVYKAIARIHEVIGHLGQKRTQMVLLRKLYWRSVRQDVRVFISNCEFCNQKKVEGKKILKAPVDITSDHFDINIEIHPKPEHDDPEYERLTFALVGYNENDVKMAATTRMTAYTFKETAPDHRTSRFPRASVSGFRRQPYIKRNRYSPYASGYLLPFGTATKKNENMQEFIEVYEDADGRIQPAYEDQGDYEEDENVLLNTMAGMQQMDRPARQQQVPEQPDTDDQQPSTSRMVHERVVKTEPEYSNIPTPSCSSRPPSAAPRVRELRRPQRSLNGGHRNRSAAMQSSGIAARFSMAVGEGERIDGGDTADLLSPYDSVQLRPELVGLAPIMLMPSMDSEVVALQKQLLHRQLEIQQLQLQALQAQLNDPMGLRIPITRYEHVDGEDQYVEEVIEEGVDMEQDLNVMDNSDDQSTRVYSNMV